MKIFVCAQHTGPVGAREIFSEPDLCSGPSLSLSHGRVHAQIQIAAVPRSLVAVPPLSSGYQLVRAGHVDQRFPHPSAARRGVLPRIVYHLGGERLESGRLHVREFERRSPRHAHAPVLVRGMVDDECRCLLPNLDLANSWLA